MSEFDTKHRKYPICPHCWHVHEDAYELEMSGGDCIEEDCWNCGKKIQIACHVSVTYSTKKIEEAL